jgi:hypothetical protein
MHTVLPAGNITKKNFHFKTNKKNSKIQLYNFNFIILNNLISFIFTGLIPECPALIFQNEDGNGQPYCFCPSYGALPSS